MHPELKGNTPNKTPIKKVICKIQKSCYIMSYLLRHACEIHDIGLLFTLMFLLIFKLIGFS